MKTNAVDVVLYLTQTERIGSAQRATDRFVGGAMLARARNVQRARRARMSRIHKIRQRLRTATDGGKWSKYCCASGHNDEYRYVIPRRSGGRHIAEVLYRVEVTHNNLIRNYDLLDSMNGQGIVDKYNEALEGKDE